MPEKIDVLPGARPEIRDMAGVATDDEIAEFLDHRLQDARAARIERKNQIFADHTIIAMNKNQNAAERMQLAERTADRLVELEFDSAGFDARDFHDDALGRTCGIANLIALQRSRDRDRSQGPALAALCSVHRPARRKE